jgi:hypothetical protein
MKKRKTPYKLDDRLTFGQYRDRTIRSIIQTEVKYIHWLWAHEAEFEKEVWDEVKKQEAAERGDKPNG